MSMWRDAKRVLPEDGEAVLVIVNGKPRNNITLINAYELAEWSLNDGWILECWPEWRGALVTYWMPLPEPPEATHDA